MTKEEIMKINAGCANGFKFDLFSFATHKEKELVNRIPVEDDEYLEAKLEWHTVFIKKTNDYGCTYNVATGEVKPVLRLSMWHKSPSGNAYVSHGLGYTFDAGNPTKRRSVKVLQELTKEYNIGRCLNFYDDAKRG